MNKPILMQTESGNTITGCWAVDKLFAIGTKAALRYWLLASGPTHFDLCKSFSCKACPEIKLTKKPALHIFRGRKRMHNLIELTLNQATGTYSTLVGRSVFVLVPGHWRFKAAFPQSNHGNNGAPKSLVTIR